MYGIVNKALEDLITQSFGKPVWDAVLKRSGVDIDFFIGNEPYDDAITYSLAQAASEETGRPLDAVLTLFGEWWVVRTGKEKYRGLMEAGGSSVAEFLINLPVFHNRIMLIYPNLTPPEFRVSNVEGKSLHLHYYSRRPGLCEFVRGLLLGIGKLYGTTVTVELLQSRTDGSDHEEFLITW